MESTIILNKIYKNFCLGVMGPTYEDYHAAQLSIIHSVLRVGGFLESFLELDMVSLFNKIRPFYKKNSL